MKYRYMREKGRDWEREESDRCKRLFAVMRRKDVGVCVALLYNEMG